MKLYLSDSANNYSLELLTIVYKLWNRFYQINNVLKSFQVIDFNVNNYKVYTSQKTIIALTITYGPFKADKTSLIIVKLCLAHFC